MVHLNRVAVAVDLDKRLLHNTVHHNREDNRADNKADSVEDHLKAMDLHLLPHLLMVFLLGIHSVAAALVQAAVHWDQEALVSLVDQAIFLHHLVISIHNVHPAHMERLLKVLHDHLNHTVHHHKVLQDLLNHTVLHHKALDHLDLKVIHRAVHLKALEAA